MTTGIILCVDDEEAILESLEDELLRELGEDFFYEFASGPEEALEICSEIASDTKPIIVISDWLMPVMKGDELFKEVHKTMPNTIKILLTGQASAEAVEAARNEANLDFYLEKPWKGEELISIIKEGLQKINQVKF